MVHRGPDRRHATRLGLLLPGRAACRCVERHRSAAAAAAAGPAILGSVGTAAALLLLLLLLAVMVH